MATISRVVIYDKTGATLCELQTPTVRTWTINKFGQAEFVISKLNADFNAKNMRDGNLINIYGTNLPPWSGVVTEFQKWMRDGTVVVTCYGPEYMLGWRIAQQNYAGTTAAILSSLVKSANASETLPIYPGTIYDDGIVLGQGQAVGSPGMSLYEVLQSTFNLSNLEYSFDLSPDQYGKVLFSANVLPALGRISTDYLEEGMSVMLPSGLVMQSQGNIANRVYGFQQAVATPTYTLEDVASRSQYGLREDQITVQSGVSPNVYVNAAIKARKQPQRGWTILVQDINGAFNLLGLGNQVPLKMHSVGFDPATGNLGFNGVIRITSMTFSDATGECLLTVEELVS